MVHIKTGAMKSTKTTPVNKKTPANGQAAKAESPRRNNPTNRSQNDDKDYDGSDFDNEDYNGKNFKDEDDYNSGKLGRGAEESGEDDIKDIPRRKSKN